MLTWAGVGIRSYKAGGLAPAGGTAAPADGKPAAAGPAVTPTNATTAEPAASSSK